MKIVIVNSTGPMGSSVVAALVEQFGYLNLPIRDLGMNEFLISKRVVDSDNFLNNFINVFSSNSVVVKSGGVNIPDRDKSPPYQRIDKKLIEQDINNIENKQFKDFSELYCELRAIYLKAVKYKRSNHVPGKHVELTTDFYLNQPEKLSRSYLREFKDVIFIHLHRDFSGWIESIASQRFSSPKKRHKFFFHKLCKRYFDYENSIKDCPGLHLNFNSLFLPETYLLIDNIAKAINEPVPDIQWEDELYDLYGNFRDFKTTFTLADCEGKYLSSITLNIIKYVIRKKKITYFDDAVIYVFYLYDLLRFLVKKRMTLLRNHQ